MTDARLSIGPTSNDELGWTLDRHILERQRRIQGATGDFTGLFQSIALACRVIASKVQKAVSYDVQVATADPTVESNWNLAGSFAGCRRIELGGLTPGKVYSVRMRALGSAGPGPWTPASSLMVV